MSNIRSQARNDAPPKIIAGWDDAIADAKQRLKDIQFALKEFKECKRRGEPWPIDAKQKAPAVQGLRWERNEITVFQFCSGQARTP